MLILLSIFVTDIAATALSISMPDPTTGGFTEGTDEAVTFTLTYTVTDSGGSPSAVTVYFRSADGSITSNPVTATGANAPDSSAVTTDGSYTDLTATLTLDANCQQYSQVCASLTLLDANTDNNVFCIEFGTAADKAGTKTCTSGNFRLLFSPEF